MATKYLRIMVVPTKRTDLLCMRCGRFGSQLAVVFPDRLDDQQAEAGVHKGCVDATRVRFTRKRRDGNGAQTQEDEVQS